MPDLVEFLRARLAEEEAAAKAAYGESWIRGKDRGPTYWFGSGDEPRPLPQECGYVIYGTDYLGRVGHVANCEVAHEKEQTSVHIATWDPARVLAEIQAKRAILDLHPFRHEDARSDGYGTSDAVDYCGTCAELDKYEQPYPCWPCPTLLALAQPYADHPGFDPAWRTEAARG